MKQTSQQSPYSPELQSFILTKYDPLLSIVRELNDRLEAGDKERFRLEKRLAQLEEYLKRNEGDDHFDRSGENSKASQIITEDLRVLGDVMAVNENESGLSPWLFSCQTSTPTASIQALLEFSPDSTAELEVRQWNAEEDMWIALLEDLPSKWRETAAIILKLNVRVRPIAGIDVVRPQSLTLAHLRCSVRHALIDACKNEVLLILRNVPGRDAAAQFKTLITLVAILATALSEAWQRVDKSTPNNLGRVALVLEGDNLGTRLRAGKNKFVIEPLN